MDQGTGQASFGDRLRYGFDNFMSRGTVALMGGLAAVTGALILLVSLVIVALRIAPADSEPLSPAEALWSGMMHALDAGTLGGDTGWAFRGVMLVTTLGGLFILSALIGVINTGLEARLDELRKGRSRVIEQNHTVILGWSPQIFPVLTELALANEDRRDACVVVLGPADKVEMETAIREKLGDTKLRVVCRSGSPIDMDDLQIVSLQVSRAIIVLAPEDSENPDAEVIKALLAVVNHPLRRPTPYHIVAEMHDDRNADVARMVGRDELEIVQIGTLIARIAAQTCRQSGLSVVYTELLDFGGDEIYLREEPALVGKTYGDALHAYPKCSIVGYAPRGGTPTLNPPMSTPIQAGDQLVMVAADDSAIRYAPRAAPPPPALPLEVPALPEPEQTLILGWSWRVPVIINELDRYVPPGSDVTVVAASDSAESLLAARCSTLQNIRYTLVNGDTTDRTVLERLTDEALDHIIVVSEEGLSTQGADARTLITLLHLRDIDAKRGLNCSIVSEIRDLRNRALAEATRADDFIISDRLLSLLMAQICETKALNAVFGDIFDPDGAEIYLKPASRYAPIGTPVDFHQIISAASARGETAFGYRVAERAREATASYGVNLNPEKTAKIVFSAEDRIIVMADS